VAFRDHRNFRDCSIGGNRVYGVEERAMSLAARDAQSTI
jgi:hypothetical protein